MQTAAGQLGVAIENARLFTEEQRRARHLAFLNNISKMAISSEDAEQMMADIVREIQKNFRYDHIGIGIMDYATKDIEIKAEAGSTSQALGRRIAVGTGVLGKVARTGSKRAGAKRRSGAVGGRVAGIARRALLADHVRRDAAGRAQRGEPVGECVCSPGRADSEYSGRPVWQRRCTTRSSSRNCSSNRSPTA